MFGRNHRPVAREAPAANEYSRGWLAIVLGATGVADALKWVRKTAADSYEVAEVSLTDHEHDADYAALSHTHALADITDDGTMAAQNANNVSITGGSISGITDLAVADGGTGASNASGARTNLGLVIGTHVQAWDADLDAWSGKTAPSGTVVGDTDTQTLTNKTITGAILDGQTRASGTNPTVAVNTGVCGSTATASVTFGNDTAMRVEVSCSGVGYAAGTAFTINFAATRPSSSYGVWIQPVSSQALAKGWRSTSHGTTSVAIVTDTAPANGETLQLNILIIGDA